MSISIKKRQRINKFAAGERPEANYIYTYIYIERDMYKYIYIYILV